MFTIKLSHVDNFVVAQPTYAIIKCVPHTCPHDGKLCFSDANATWTKSKILHSI